MFVTEFERSSEHIQCSLSVHYGYLQRCLQAIQCPGCIWKCFHSDAMQASDVVNWHLQASFILIQTTWHEVDPTWIAKDKRWYKVTKAICRKFLLNNIRRVIAQVHMRSTSVPTSSWSSKGPQYFDKRSLPPPQVVDTRCESQIQNKP